MAGSKNTQITGLQKLRYLNIQKRVCKDTVFSLIFKSSIWNRPFNILNTLGSRIEALDQQPALIDVTSYIIRNTHLPLSGVPVWDRFWDKHNIHVQWQSQ